MLKLDYLRKPISESDLIGLNLDSNKISSKYSNYKSVKLFADYCKAKNDGRMPYAFK